MSKLNLKDTLDKSIKIWQYLIDNPADCKTDAYRTLNLEEDYLDCPFCEYVSDPTYRKIDAYFLYIDNLDCTKCPAYGRWGDNGELTCIEDTTYYMLWTDAESDEQRVESATNIVELMKLIKSENGYD